MRTPPRGLPPIVALAGVSLVLTGCSGDDDAGVTEMSEGQALFTVHCATCHGEQGLGDGPMAAGLPVQPPGLMEHLGHHAEDQLVQIIRTGVPPAMPPAALTEEQVRLVVDYAWTLVPDSLVEGLRAMQRMAEMGMDMGTGMEMGMDSSRAMSSMSGDSSGEIMPRDTTRH